MILRMTSGTLALLAFSSAIFAGLVAGNDMTTILSRAMSAMVLFLLLGALVGWMAQTVICEHIKAEAEAEESEGHPDQETEQTDPAQGVSTDRQNGQGDAKI